MIHKKIAFLTVISMFLAFGLSPVFSVPAAPKVHTLEQKDGSKFVAKQWGDEWSHGWETTDGYTIIFDEDTKYWAYAITDANGSLFSSSRIVGKDSPPNNIPKHLRQSKEALAKAPKTRAPQAPTTPEKVVPPTGTANVPVILINFNDRSTTYTAANFNTLLFGDGTKSMKDYYEEVSYGVFSVSAGPGGIMGWYTASNGHDWYGLIAGWPRAAQLAKEAATAADPTVNFASYDSDGDCYVDVASIVHQGDGAEASGNYNDIWSHSWSFTGAGIGAYTTNDACPAGGKIKVNDYVMQPETLWGGMSTMGVFAHEYGHALGLPDLYDTDYTSYGIGDWSLMAGGSWNGITQLGDTPAHLDAWSKWFLQWVSPIRINTSNFTQIKQVENNSEVYQFLNNPSAVQDWKSNGVGQGEYFLVENRRKVGFDAALPGEGLLIWHIDETRTGNTNESRYLVALEQADGLFHLENKVNQGDANDPWKSSVAGFTESSTPNSKLYNGSASSVRVTDISASASVMTANLIIGWPPSSITFVSPTPANNSNLSRRYVFINISSSETLSAAIVEWNGTNYTMSSLSGNRWYKNMTNLTTGTYVYSVYGNDTTGNWNVSETRVVNIDITPPIITILSPPNSTINDNTPLLNVTFGEVVNATWYNNGTKNSTPAYGTSNLTLNLTALSDGQHNITVYANDSLGNLNSSKVYFTIDTIPPTITIRSPVNTTTSDNTPLLNATFREVVNYAWYNIDSGANSTLYGNTTNLTIEITPALSDGQHNITVYANDSVGNLNFSVVYFTVDTTPPAIMLSSPQNTTYNAKEIWLNYSINEATSWLGYSLDGAPNVTITGNTTVNMTKTGQHFLALYANDTAGNLNSSSVYFSINYSFPVKNLNKNQNYTKIQDAVNEAGENDTITVDAGNYSENVDINKSINLVGAGADVTIINASNPNDHVVEITANWVNVSGFSLRGANENGKAGIYLNEANYNNISNNNISNNSLGTSLNQARNNKLSKNLIVANAQGIGLELSNYNEILNNTISNNNGVGVFVHTSNSNIIMNNSIISNARYGIKISDNGNYNNITNNNVSLNSNIAIGTSGSHYTRILDNILISNSYGFYIFGSENTSIINNTVVASGGYGIRIEFDVLYGNNNSIYHNNFINNTNKSIDTGNNTWDSGYPSGGNYWSDFDNSTEGCSDANSDGVCDSPYNISGGNNKDRYPVVLQNGWLSITPDTTPPNITITSPQNKSYNSSRIWLNFSLSSDVMDRIGYSLNDSAIVMVSGNTSLNASEGYHNLTLYAIDSFGNVNSSTVFFTVDLSAPLINSIEISPVIANDIVNITVNATDKITSISAVAVNITYPNKTSVVLPAAQNSSLYSTSFNASQYGIYNLTVLANDTAGNANISKTSFASVKKNETLKEIKNGTNETVYKDEDVEIIVFADEAGNATINVSIGISKLASSFALVPEINSTLSDSKAEKGLKYLNLTNKTKLENITKIRIKLFYKDSETSENSLDENKYAVYYWNGTKWLKLSDYKNGTAPNGPFVFDAGLDKENNFAFADINHFSVYGIGGSIQSGGSSGGGGGGGGGGIPDLLHLNRWWELCFGDCLIVYGKNAAKEDVDIANQLLDELKQKLIQWGSATVRERVNRGAIKVYNESELSEQYLMTNHLILIGGDYANTITAKVNKTNKFELVSGMRWKINANNTRQVESENGATLEFAASPYSPYRKVLVVAGNTRKGTARAGGYLIARLVGEESANALE